MIKITANHIANGTDNGNMITITITTTMMIVMNWWFSWLEILWHWDLNEMAAILQTLLKCFCMENIRILIQICLTFHGPINNMTASWPDSLTHKCIHAFIRTAKMFYELSNICMWFSGLRFPFMDIDRSRWNDFGCITVTSFWARWCLKSPASRLFTEQFIQAQMKWNIKALRYWPLCGEFTGDRWIPCTKGQ